MKNSASKLDLRKITRIRLPQSYPWKLLGSLTEDLQCSLPEDKVRELKDIIRKRDIPGYMALSETWREQGMFSSDTKTDQVFALYQASSLLKKYQFSTDSNIRRQRAIDKFMAAEEVCRNFNLSGSKTLASLTDVSELSAFSFARKFIERLLGDFLPEVQRMTLWSRHGPGSNTDTKQGMVSLYDKYSNWPYSCTAKALRSARLAIQNDERWLGALEDSYRERYNVPKHQILDQVTFWSNVFKVQDTNRITFVPKNGLIDRSIAIEPCMNLYLQLGVDGFIRRRLMRWGVNLDDQTKNQRLAQVGSQLWDGDDPFVTIDLAAASDTVSTELCRLLLPPQWYTYLMDIRSPSGTLNEEILDYEKISSMGNGYTFALESLVFTALVYAVERVTHGSYKRELVAVYGDDLIVRRSSSTLLVRMLNLCGFTVNSEKSFFEGPFRESCGADWFKGTPVRPVFVKNQPSTVMELWNDLNRIRRILSLRRGSFESKCESLLERWIPITLRAIVGPHSDEDFDSYRHVSVPSSRYRNGLWLHPRIVVTAKRLHASNFLFRKLMHTLRPSRETEQSSLWGGVRVTGAGSRFTVTKRNRVTVRYTSSPVSNWRDEYADHRH